MGYFARLLKTRLAGSRWKFARTVDEWIWFHKSVSRLKREAVNCHTPLEMFRALQRTPLSAIQNETEIVALLDLVAKLRPERVAEIGSYNGGTLLLFSRVSSPTAHLVALDLDLELRQWGFSRLALPGQRVTCFACDSHAESTRDRLAKAIGGQPLDFLFIDGDHRFDGVSRDFALYSPLVRAGGLIAFHDIMPNHAIKSGAPRGPDGGDVWKFWKQLREIYPDHQELLHDGPDQDGWGIGVLRWAGPGQTLTPSC
ncbi:MAG TPA: class I SAM-dependent methyltransferase [Tepidisphaeraceae bacterium]|nr:class I SAM-dependent methyltransferase [Tepidisphaeraceae bacterium]